MPGVIVRTETRSGPVNPTVPASGRYFVAGLFERGPASTPVRCRSLAEVEVTFGGRVPYGAAYDDLRTYFEEGGTEAYVARAVGTAATKGTLNLKDRATAPGLNTLAIDAVGAGPWSTGVTVAVAAGTADGTYQLVITGPGGAAGATPFTERFDNLTTPADAVAATAPRIGADGRQVGGSRFVRARDLGSPTAAPANQPVTLAPTPLSAGTDDRGTVTATALGNLLGVFNPELGAGAVAVPGYASTLVGAALMGHAKSHRRLALMAPAQGADEGAALAAADALIGNDGEFGGLFYPWVRIPTSATSSKLVSPEGYVAAMRARAHRDVGPWQVPAGEIAVARFILGTEVDVDRAMGDRLNEGHVSAIRTIAGGTRLYGWRSLSTDADNYSLLIGRDVLNTVAVEAYNLLERFVFKPVDGKGQLLASVAAALVGLLEPIRAAGGLFERVIDGEQIDPGYSVDVGDTVNSVAVLQANTIAAVIALRVSPASELIDLTIVKAGLSAAV